MVASLIEQRVLARFLARKLQLSLHECKYITSIRRNCFKLYKAMYENNLCDEAIELGGSIWLDDHDSFEFGITEHYAIEKEAWMFSREYEKEYGDDCLECERFRIAKKYKTYYSRDKLSCKKCKKG